MTHFYLPERFQRIVAPIALTNRNHLKNIEHHDRQHAVCFGCGVAHKLHGKTYGHRLSEVRDFSEKHKRYDCLVKVEFLDNAESLFRGNADVKEAFQSEQTMTTTNLQSLASSTTAGWKSAVVDNTSNLYLDALVQFVIAAVNTAPSSNKAIYVFAYHGSNSSDLTTSGAAANNGSEGTLTFPNITSSAIVMPILGVLPYTTQNVAFTSLEMSVGMTAGGALPPYWGVAALNYSGMTLASSGNTVKYRGVYNTVV